MNSVTYLDFHKHTFMNNFSTLILKGTLRNFAHAFYLFLNFFGSRGMLSNIYIGFDRLKDE